MEHTDYRVSILADFEIIAHDYKILIGLLDGKSFFKATKYADNIYLSSIQFSSKLNEVLEYIDYILPKFSNIECDIRTSDNLDTIAFHSNNLRLVFVYEKPTNIISVGSYLTKLIYNYLSEHEYLFDINTSEYVLK